MNLLEAQNFSIRFNWIEQKKDIVIILLLKQFSNDCRKYLRDFDCFAKWLARVIFPANDEA